MTATMSAAAPQSSKAELPTTACRVCGGATESTGQRHGAFAGRGFHFRHCATCRFSFVEDPWTDYAAIYDERYYRGEGADPYVDYYFELEHPGETVRRYEWDGILAAVSALRPVDAQTRWLDFGCGHGGLVRHVAANTGCTVAGTDTGGIVATAREKGVNILDEQELGAWAGKCDVVTAIEVLEHLPDPIAVLRRIRALLKPGGLFFYTTGNARPFRGRLTTWSYALPEIHVSFFEPETLAGALRAAGFRPEFCPPFPGLDQIIRFKILKRLGFRRRSWVERMLPWPVFLPLLRRRLEIGAHPIGWAV
jgi:2-polyprenyl-3-methyl-5-hydroxy-6-metoxy-1,4-benzoquinol methylase